MNLFLENVLRFTSSLSAYKHTTIGIGRTEMVWYKESYFRINIRTDRSFVKRSSLGIQKRFPHTLDIYSLLIYDSSPEKTYFN